MNETTLQAIRVASDEEIEARRQQTGRQCGHCTMCCYVLGVDAPPKMSKPPDVWCKHCEPSKGCMIYDDRPKACRRFHCQWLLDASFDDAWYPAKSRIVINLTGYSDGSNACLVFEVDPRRPDRWLQHPYFEIISNIALAHHGTTVRVGQRWYILVPRSVAENPSRITNTASRGIAKIIPGKVGRDYVQSAFDQFAWIEVVPTAEARERWKAAIAGSPSVDGAAP